MPYGLLVGCFRCSLAPTLVRASAVDHCLCVSYIFPPAQIYLHRRLSPYHPSETTSDGQSVERMRVAMLRAFALLSALPCTAAAWSFANFLQGDWDLERVKGDELIRAHYSLQTAPGGALEGSFFEEDSAGGRSNEMRVKVEFDLAAPDIAGSFSMAKAKVFEDDDEAAAPVPQPAGEVEYGEFKALFEFDFHSRNSDHYWISESK